MIWPSGYTILFFLISLGIGVFIGFWTYRKTIPQVNPFVRFCLFLLRALTLTCLLLLILRPFADFRVTRKKKPNLAFLLDTSQSMRFGNGKSRMEELQELMKSPTIKKIRKQSESFVFLFSDTVRSFPLNQWDENAPSANGIATDIASALATVEKFDEETPFRAVLLFSDGAHNVGRDPLRVAEEMHCPVHTIALGKRHSEKDIRLTEVGMPERVYENVEVSIPVAVTATGFAGKKAELRLLVLSAPNPGPPIVDTLHFSLPEDEMETPLIFHFSPNRGEGKYRLRVEIPPFPEERIKENNAREVVCHVEKSRIRVVLFADAPDPSVGTIRRILEADSEIVCIPKIWQTGSRFYESNFSPLQWDSVDVVILFQLPSVEFPEFIWKEVIRGIGNYKKPFLFLAGKPLDMKKLNSLAERLPGNLIFSSEKKSLNPLLTSEGEAHPLMGMAFPEEPLVRKEIWDHLPPLDSYWEQTELKPEAIVLLEGENPMARIKDSGSPGRFPLIVALQDKNGKAIFVLGDGLYRWNLMPWGIGKTNSALVSFLSNAMRWLARISPAKPVQFVSKLSSVSAGEKVQWTVQVTDEMARPFSNAEVRLHFSSGISELTLEPSSGGIYQGQTYLTYTGPLQIIAEAQYKGKILGRDTLECQVLPFTPEMSRTAPNPELLQEISRITAGSFLAPDRLDTLLSVIDFSTERITENKVFSLLHSPWIFFLILLSLTLEWLIRKRMGMM